MTPSEPTSSHPSHPLQTSRRYGPVHVAFILSYRTGARVRNRLTRLSDLEAQVDTPGRESVEQAGAVAERIWMIASKFTSLRQFLQTSTLVDADGMIVLLRHFLAKAAHTDASRDKIDFLLVPVFSARARLPNLTTTAADISYVAQGLESVLGPVELKTPVWLNALDRVLEAARRCRSLDELLHGGVLEQGRKAKAQAVDLFYLPICAGGVHSFLDTSCGASSSASCSPISTTFSTGLPNWKKKESRPSTAGEPSSRRRSRLCGCA